MKFLASFNELEVLDTNSAAARPQHLDAILDAAAKAAVIDVINVDGKLRFPGQLLRTGRLIFQSDATLVMDIIKTQPGLPWVAVYADEIFIQDPFEAGMIERPDETESLAGATGDGGSKGTADWPVSNDNSEGQGRSGGLGGDGKSGEDVPTPVRLPDFYLITRSIRSDTDPTPALVLSFEGLRGNRGGSGGPGGDGGHGESGRASKSGFLDCSRGPGHGGNGGPGGTGGPAGRGSDGGPGANIFIVGSKGVMQSALGLIIHNAGGPKGTHGDSGAGGSGGAKGFQGKTPGPFCKKTDGRDGSKGTGGKPGPAVLEPELVSGASGKISHFQMKV